MASRRGCRQAFEGYLGAIKNAMLFFHTVARFVGQVNFMQNNTVNGKIAETEELLTLNVEA
jgi:hypothetical protein